MGQLQPNVLNSALPGAPTFLKAPSDTPLSEDSGLTAAVREIIADVRQNGDAALRRMTQKFDGVALDNFIVSSDEIEAARRRLDDSLLRDLEFGVERITAFARLQRQALTAVEAEVLPGVHIGHRLIPVRRVGAYVPGGRYPLLSSAQMAIIPAKVAGVDEIHVCTPPKVHPAVLYAAHRSGATRIYRVGGAQGIAALAFGTATIPAVDKICGPGNKYVNEAKRQVLGFVGIDQLAGPSEIFIIADKTGDPRIIAADLLGQAEHDVDTRVGLITDDADLARAAMTEIKRQLPLLSTVDVARVAWERRGEVALCPDLDACIAYSDHVGPEHLQVHTADPTAIGERLRNYGSLFIGVEASVVYSDKIVGTNHILPTGAAARYTGGVWVGTFLKVCTHQRLTNRGVEVIAPIAARQSAREGLDGHRKAAAIRLDPAVV